MLETPAEPVTEDGRPDFAAFARALRSEAAWSASIHGTDRTGQAASDQQALNELADRVEALGVRLGFLGATSSIKDGESGPDPEFKALHGVFSELERLSEPRVDGYPADWPRCPSCGAPALDGHITCGSAQCDEGEHRRR